MKKVLDKIFIMAFLCFDIVFAIGCNTFNYCKSCSDDKAFMVNDKKAKSIYFVYKPGPKAPAYKVLLPSPADWTKTWLIKGSSYSYRFDYGQKKFFITDEYCQQDNGNWQSLQKRYEIMRDKDTIINPLQGIIDCEGSDDNGIWRYILLYDLSKKSTTNLWTFERLYIGYDGASVQDTCELNRCIFSYTLIDSTTYEYYYKLRLR